MSSTQSIILDGSNEFVTMGDPSALKFAHTDPFSIAFWAKWTTTTGTIISKTLSSGTFRGWSVGCSATGQILVILRNDLSGSNQIFKRTPISFPNGIGNWFHFCFTWAGSAGPSWPASDLKFYMNGAFLPNSIVATDNLSGTIDSAGAFSLGSRNATDSFWAGSMDDPAVYDKELSASEIKTIYNWGNPPDLTSVGPTGNLVGYWPIDGDTHPTLVDASTNSNDGTMTNTESSDIQDDAPNANSSAVEQGHDNNRPALITAEANPSGLSPGTRRVFFFASNTPLDSFSPPPEPDITRPVVNNFSPDNGSEISAADPIFFDVTDDSGLFRRVLVAIEQGGTTELIHDGERFLEPYLSLSERTNIANGFRYRVRRSGGWEDTVNVSVFPFDLAGNEST
jgi:hypothetical protein